MRINIVGEPVSREELKAYTLYGEQKYSDREITAITINAQGEMVNLTFEFAPVTPFVRIRRITGYLVGTLDRFNNGKRSEERDRVKHSV